MITNKKEAEEYILNSSRNICLYGGEESLDLLLEQRRLNRQTIVCAGTERLAVIKECVYLNGFLDSNEDTVKNCIQCSDLMVIYGADLISAATIDRVAELRKEYNAELRLILVGDIKTQLVCAANGFTSVDAANCWQELDLVEIDTLPPREDRDFQAYLDAFRNGVKSALGKVDQCFLPYDDTENSIVLCTAEHSAETFNEKIIGEEEFKGSFEATIEGDFPESAYPAPKVLTVNKEMPVLMVSSGKDDYNHRSYSYGEFRTIYGFDHRFITLKGEDGDPTFTTVRPNKWYRRKLSYAVDEYGCTYLVYEKVGSYEQMPCTPAYALSLETTYGMTFPSVIIDPFTTMQGELAALVSRGQSIEGVQLWSQKNNQD